LFPPQDVDTLNKKHCHSSEISQYMTDSVVALQESYSEVVMDI